MLARLEPVDSERESAGSTLCGPVSAAASPTGIDPRDLEGMRERRLRRLGRLHARLAGDDDGRPWWGLAVRRLPLGERVEMAEDDEYLAHWQELERRRVVQSPEYFVEGYGHVQPERQGEPPIPFELWPMVEAAAERCIGARSQREVLEAFVRDNVVVVLKARQLGLTWLALHFGFWLMGFDADLVAAKVLALSKREEDAKKLLRRMRRINRLLPPFLRLLEARETVGSLTHFKLEGRGEAISLTSTPDAARTEQADLFIWDEAAFARNRTFVETWTAALPTLGDHGRAIVISTGNGPEQAPGDGQGFAMLFRQAADMGSSGDLPGEDLPPMLGVFLPDDVHPDRDEAWRARESRKFLSRPNVGQEGQPATFEQEHPLTVDEALAGEQGAKVYPLAGIRAAVELGRLLDERLEAGTLAEPAGRYDGAIATGGDYGTYSHFLPIWELEGGGVYVPPGEHASFAMEASEKTRQFLENIRVNVQEPYAGGPGVELEPKVAEIRFDSAGIETASTTVAVVEGDVELHRQFEMVRSGARRRPWRVRTLSVRFNAYKTLTIGYLEWLFRRTAEQMALPPDERELAGVIAISPRNVDLLRQLRGLEYLDDGTGRVRKEDDHGPDALVAGTAPIAAENLERMPSPRDDKVNA